MLLTLQQAAKRIGRKDRRSVKRLSGLDLVRMGRYLMVEDRTLEEFVQRQTIRRARRDRLPTATRESAREILLRISPL